MSRGDWESHKLLFGEDTRLKPCPFCGAEPYVDSCDRIIDIGCDKCGYHRHFHGLVQDEIETDVVVSRYKDSRKAYEWYDKDAYQKAAAGWNERQNRLDEIVRCKDCKHYAVEDHYGNFHGYEILAASDVPTCHRWGNDTVMVKPDGYCFLGEERVCNEA